MNIKPRATKPTQSELRILKVLWNQGKDEPLSVREVLGYLDSDVGYTTVLKLLQIMFSKGLVARDESERSHRYSAAIPRTAVEGGLVTDLLQRMFDGSASQLVQAAIDTEDIDADELRRIESMIRKARRRTKTSQAQGEGR